MKLIGMIGICLTGYVAFATPDASDGFFWQWNQPASYGISRNGMERAVKEFSHPDLILAGQWPEFELQLKTTKQTVGFLRCNAAEGAIAIHTVLPWTVPQERRIAVGELFRQINELPYFSDQMGHYYVNADSGECGFVRKLNSPHSLGGMELAEHWDDCYLYQLYPEIGWAVYGNVPPEFLLCSIEQIPPDQRTPGLFKDMEAPSAPAVVADVPSPDWSIIRILNPTPKVSPDEKTEVSWSQNGYTNDNLLKEPFEISISGKRSPGKEVVIHLMFMVDEDAWYLEKRPLPPHLSWYDQLLSDAGRYGYFTPFWYAGKPYVVGLENNPSWRPEAGTLRVNLNNLIPIICEYRTQCDGNGDFKLGIPVEKVRFDTEKEPIALTELPCWQLRMVIFGDYSVNVWQRNQPDEFFDPRPDSGLGLLSVAAQRTLYFPAEHRYGKPDTNSNAQRLKKKLLEWNAAHIWPSEVTAEQTAALKRMVERNDYAGVLKLAIEFDYGGNYSLPAYAFAAQSGRAEALCEAGKSERFWLNSSQAKEYFQQAAAQGNAEAKFYLAWLKEEFAGQDDVEIFTLYKEALDGGYQNAAPELARCYWYGIGISPDRKRAFELANAFFARYPGNLKSMLIIGLWYFYEGGEREKGLKLIEEASHKIVLGSLERGLIYEYGLGGIPQRLRSVDNFGHRMAGETKYYWLNGWELNHREMERWERLNHGY